MIQAMTAEQGTERAFLSLGQPQGSETGRAPLDSFLKPLEPSRSLAFFPAYLSACH